MDKMIAAGPWKGQALFELYFKAFTPMGWFFQLFEYAKEIDITLFSSVFDEEGIDFLERIACPAYKISSFDATNILLIRKASSTGKPLIASTGIASDAEVGQAVNAALSGSTDVALLHCVSAYPCLLEHANLYRIPRLRRVFGVPVGFSDHTIGSHAAVAAVALGASIIEKHITLDNGDGSQDSFFAADPAAFRRFVHDVRSEANADSVATTLAAQSGAASEGEAAHRDLRVVRAA